MGNCCTTDELTNEFDINKANGGKTIKKPKKAAKGASASDTTASMTFEGGLDPTQMELWDDPSYLNNDSVKDSDSFSNDHIDLKRIGSTLPLFKQEVLLYINDYLPESYKTQYKILGVF